MSGFDISQQKYISELKAGETITMVLYIQKAELRSVKTGGLYWSITASDNSGTVECRIFDATGEEKVETGRIGYMTGNTEMYQGSIQIKISRIVMTDTQRPEILERVLPTSYMKHDEAVEKFESIMSKIKREDIKQLVRTVIDKCGGFDLYSNNSAAIAVHHSEIGGIIVHSIEVAKIAWTLATIYNADMDIILASSLLHDVAKLIEYNYSVYGLASEMTTKGLLFGHLYLGGELVLSAAKELNIDEETAIRIAHVVVSHHTCKNFGAITTPATLEAAIVAEADGASARITQYKNVLNGLEPGEASEAIRTLDGTRIWKPKES